MSPNHPLLPTQTDVLLADSTRRLICAILATPDPPRTVRDLAVELAARSLDVPPRAVTTDQRRRRQIQLHHHQLPKLADHGLINYSRSGRTATIIPAGVDALAAVTDSPAAPLA